MTTESGKNRSAGCKVTEIGAGMVGGTVAQLLAQRNYADVVLVDIVEGFPQGKALDLAEAGPALGYDKSVTGTNGYGEAAGSDVVVITSGIGRKPGMSRDDLRTNMGIVRPVTTQVAAVAPDAVIIVVSNARDAMCHVALEAAGFPRERVSGQAGVLDSARYRTFIARELDVSVEDVTAFVLGGHGDTMVPLSRFCTVASIPITELLPAQRIRELEERTVNGGAEIVGMLKTGSAYYAPGAAVVDMVDAILLDRKRVLAASVLLQGDYGIDNLFVGVPLKLGRYGVARIFDITLTEQERDTLQRSPSAMHELVDVMACLRAEVATGGM